MSFAPDHCLLLLHDPVGLAVVTPIVCLPSATVGVPASSSSEYDPISHMYSFVFPLSIDIVGVMYSGYR